MKSEIHSKKYLFWEKIKKLFLCYLETMTHICSYVSLNCKRYCGFTIVVFFLIQVKRVFLEQFFSRSFRENQQKTRYRAKPIQFFHACYHVRSRTPTGTRDNDKERVCGYVLRVVVKYHRDDGISKAHCCKWGSRS